MSKTQVKQEQAVPLTPAQEKLLEFFEDREIPDLLKSYKRVFELACFHTELEVQDNDKLALYMQFELTELLTQINYNKDGNN